MFDLDDMMGGSLFGAIFSFVPGEGMLLATIAILAAIGFFIAAWGFCGFTRRNIGRKAGLTKDWMAFVPFARTVYFLEVVGEQWWKMFIFEMWALWFALILWIFDLFNNDTMMTFGVILSALYLVGVVIYKVYFRIKLCKAFNMKPELALGAAATCWGVLFLRRVFECMIAYTDLFQFGEQRSQRGFGEVTMPGPKVAPGMAASGGRRAVAGGCSLSGLSGMYAGQEIPMAANDDIIIGRDASFCNIIISEKAEKVSRKHCVIRFDSARSTYTVTDCSSNGTYIDGGSKLPANIPTPVSPGTVIYLGNRENRFKLN